jgi:hypothetical protein
MFSYSINNPNNFVIQKTDYNVIPIGNKCATAIACNYANIRKMSLPFDWIVTFPNQIQQILENNFHDFIPDVHNKVFSTKYKFVHIHFNPDVDTGIEECKRRIERFNVIINQPTKIYFFYIHEAWLYNDKHREDQFNNNIFNKMLALEVFLKQKYTHIDYNILYFNFKHHNIPTNSNIINIVLHTTNVYDNAKDDAKRRQFLRFCAQIITKLFDTKLTLEGHVRFNNSSAF